MSERNTRPRSARGGLALGCALALAAGAAQTGAAQAAPQQAGVSAAVDGRVTRESTLDTDVPQAGRTLSVGSEVFLQDLIASGENSRTQILLLDESALKLGPESELVIDEFVYDPAERSGEMAARAAAGTFRFVSGVIGRRNAENVEIETPVATVGVRGTILTVDIDRNSQGQVEEALFVLSGPGIENNANARRGAILVTAQGRTVKVQRSGWGTVVRPGEPPSSPRPIPAERLAQLNAALSRGAGPTGPGGGDPTGGTVVQTGAAQLAGQTTAQTLTSGSQTQQTSASADSAQDEASGEDLEDATLGEEVAVGQPVLIEPGTSPSGVFNNLDQPISTFDLVNQVSSGIATASETNVKMVDIAGTSRFGPSGEINVFSTAGQERLGSYDVFFRANFSEKTFVARFDDIDVAVQDLQNGAVSQAADLPESGIAFITFTAGSDGFNGVTANQACKDAGCAAAIDLLALDGKPVGGIAHSLAVGNVGGAGSVRTSDR
jgi:hypothetical protein